MSAAEAQVANHIERRRSERFPLALPLTVRGVSLDMRPFQQDTVTLSVSDHGALLALSTTVTLGQTLFVMNPQTQDKVEAWVTRFGIPYGAMTTVGIEFARPDANFWSANLLPKSAPEKTGRDAEQEIHLVPKPVDTAAAAQDSNGNGNGDGASHAEEPSPRSDASDRASAPDVLLLGLEKALHEAADRAVEAIVNERLGAAVNQAAESIENFSQSRIRQLEERLAQFGEGYAASAHEKLLAGFREEIAQSREQLRGLAAELLETTAREVHGSFTERLARLPIWRHPNLPRKLPARWRSTSRASATKCTLPPTKHSRK